MKLLMQLLIYGRFWVTAKASSALVHPVALQIHHVSRFDAVRLGIERLQFIRS
jgi:hypothetical protein